MEQLRGGYYVGLTMTTITAKRLVGSKHFYKYFLKNFIWCEIARVNFTWIDMHLVNFSSEAAINYGVEDAVLLWAISTKFRKCHWLGQNFHNDEVWIPLDTWELKFQLPFWSQVKINSVLKSLVSKGVVKKERRYEIRREFSYHVAKEIYLE